MFKNFFKIVHDPPEFTSFKVFQFLGYFFGGIGPVIIFFLIELFGWEQDVIASEYIGRFVFLTLIGAVIGIIAFYIEHVYHEKHTLFGVFFFLQAIFSVCFIHLLVAYSGGPKASVFNFSYLYLPAVVGFCFGKGIKLYGAVVLLSISVIINLFFTEFNLPWSQALLNCGKSFCPQDASSSNWKIGSTYIWFITYIIQIIVTVAIVSQRKIQFKKKETELPNENKS